ncbi:hypothetical protein JTB14_006231 [Gonioctena quinquepunctata]|nr:hypothetical protein JTB14_006231 [Gonioctena quinquepunctata]
MAGPKSKKSKNRQRKVSSSSTNSRDEKGRRASKRDKKQENNSESATKSSSSKLTTVGRQTNNSLSAATGQILIQPLTNPHKKKLKTSQVFRQTDEDLQTGMHKILDYVQNHEDAWPFADPVEEEYAPNYYTVIRKPMDLQRMEERLDSGYYKSYSKFRADFQLIVDNCRLYNGAENEYTEMVGNLLQVFEKATEKYLDQISSSDDEIAIEFVNEEVAKDNKTKKQEEVTSTTITSKRKPMLAAQTDKKRDRSPSEESFKSLRSNSYESLHEEIETKPARRKRGDIVEEVKEKQGKVSKSKVEESDKLETKNDSKKEKKEKPVAKKEKPDLKKEKQDAKKEKPDAKKEKLNAKNEKPDLKKEKSDVKREKSDAKKEKSDAKKEKSDGKKEKSDAKKEKPDTRKEKHDTTRKETKKDKSETKECETKKTKTEKKKNKHEAKKVKADKKAAKDSKSKSKKANRKEKKKAQIRGRSSSKSPSRSPPPSDLSSPPPSWPPSSPDSRFEFMPKPDTLKRQSRDLMESEDSDNYSKQNPFEDYFQDFEVPTAHQDKKLKKDDPPLSPKPKDKHNKLRETIEKLKAKSEMKLKTEFLFEPDQLKENKDKNKKPEKEDKTKSKAKEKPFQKSVKKDVELDLDNSTMDSVHSDGKKKKPAPKVPVPTNKSSSNMDALSIATEQTLKDINKWLDDTPKFSEFSSASNSPSYTGLDEFETLNNKLEQISGRKVEKPPVPKKENAVKDLKKRPFRDPSKFFKRREVQRTIDRLQPGKGKGNLISNVQNAAKTDEIFPLGPLSKMKDTKNSLIVKTDTNAPKLSLGSVLDSFGKHKFVDDQKKEPEKAPVAVSKEEKSADVAQDSKKEDAEKSGVAGVALVEEVKNIVESKTEKEPAVLEDASSGGGATPNLSAWFKAFGAPKLPAPAKKSDDKPEGKTNEKPEENKPAEARKVPIPAASPNTDSPVMPQGQPISRQRRISTGSSMSERSRSARTWTRPRRDGRARSLPRALSLPAA